MQPSLYRPLLHFNPHFRKGSDRKGKRSGTSAREVTAGKVKIPVRDTISIHTSAREVTMCCNGIRWYKWFQSTLPQGKWPLVTRINGFSLQISIHTSAREVTYKRKAKDEASRFQSTLPQGKWRKSFWTKLCNLSYFNPHFRKGSDHNYTVVYAVFMISIHTSAREVTNPDPKLDPVSYISIHTSAREVTYPVRNIPASPGNFNPHFRKGSDQYACTDCPDCWQFQSTLPQGKWLLIYF